MPATSNSKRNMGRLVSQYLISTKDMGVYREYSKIKSKKEKKGGKREKDERKMRKAKIVNLLP